MVRKTAGRRSIGTAVPRIRLAAVLVAALLAVPACTADQPDDEPDRAAEPALRLETVHTAGEVDAETRTEVETDIGDVLSRYVVRAFLGDYPRQDFVRSFDDFTPLTARDGARDIEVLTGAGLADAASVRASALGADLSLLAPEGGVVGATAEIDFRFLMTTGESGPTTVTLSGRMDLVVEDGTWSVFGYEVTLTDGGPVEAAVSS